MCLMRSHYRSHHLRKITVLLFFLSLKNHPAALEPAMLSPAKESTPSRRPRRGKFYGCSPCCTWPGNQTPFSKIAYLLFLQTGYYFRTKHYRVEEIAAMQHSYLPLKAWWWRIMQGGETESYSYLPWVIKGAPHTFACDQVLNPSDT